MYVFKIEMDFEERWEAGTVQGWEDKDGRSNADQSTIDMDDYETVDELVELGPEKLKQVNLF